jgi:hypothetical protein
MSQFEKLSDKGVIVPPTFSAGSGLGNMVAQQFDIKSVVVVETKPVMAKDGLTKLYDIIVSCGTLVKNDFSLKSPSGVAPYVAAYYNPLNIGNTKSIVEPISYLNSDDFDAKIRSNGTLFIYQTEVKPDC